MAVYVCIKQVPNVEAIPLVRPEEGFLQADAWLMNPLDGYALQEALHAAQLVGEPCVALSAGGAEAEDALRLALALGAERAARVEGLAPLAGPMLTASCLAALIRQDVSEHDEPFSLVFCGRQSADTAGMQTPYRLARLMDCGVISDVNAWSLKSDTGAITVLRQSGGFRQKVEADRPCVLAVNRGVKDLPRPTLPGIMKAKKKHVRVLSILEAERMAAALFPESAGIFHAQEPQLVRIGETREDNRVRMAQGSTTEEKVRNLLDMLREDGSL